MRIHGLTRKERREARVAEELSAQSRLGDAVVLLGAYGEALDSADEDVVENCEAVRERVEVFLGALDA